MKVEFSADQIGCACFEYAWSKGLLIGFAPGECVDTKATFHTQGEVLTMTLEATKREDPK